MENQYIILKKVKVLGANCIAGLTYGFPSITAFMGFTHALSRQLKELNGIELGSVGVLCHDHQVNAYRSSKFEPYSFAQSRNPLNEKGLTAPINEDGKMNLTVSLVIQASGINAANESSSIKQCNEIKETAEIQKLAGGNIVSIEDCYVVKSDCHKQILRPLMPLFALVDRSTLLADKTKDGKNKLEGLLEFASLTYESTDIPLEADGSDKVIWKQSNKTKGYTVPLHVGYKLVANTFDAGTVQNVRDNEVPVSFVEPIHSVAEWVGAPSRLDSLDDLMWHYHYEPPFYVCRSLNQIDSDIEDDEFDF